MELATRIERMALNGMRCSVVRIGGKWTVNGRNIDQMTPSERVFLNQFFEDAKIEFDK